MCIRDRRQLYLQSYSAQRAEIAELLGVHGVSPPHETDIHADAGRVVTDAIAVSYTHLDVYKRQSAWRSEARGAFDQRWNADCPRYRDSQRLYHSGRRVASEHPDCQAWGESWTVFLLQMPDR